LIDINNAFELLKQPNCVKVIIKMMWYVSCKTIYNKGQEDSYSTPLDILKLH
jgi:hypothetical protein